MAGVKWASIALAEKFRLSDTACFDFGFPGKSKQKQVNKDYKRYNGIGEETGILASVAWARLRNENHKKKH